MPKQNKWVLIRLLVETGIYTANSGRIQLEPLYLLCSHYTVLQYRSVQVVGTCVSLCWRQWEAGNANLLDESMAWELKPGCGSRSFQARLNNTTILYQSKSYCAPYVLLPFQIRSWKAKIFCTEFPNRVQRESSENNQAIHMWDSSVPQALRTLAGKGRLNLISLLNLFKFPFHDLQPILCANGICNHCHFWKGKHRNCGYYSVSRATDKIYSFSQFSIYLPGHSGCALESTIWLLV